MAIKALTRDEIDQLAKLLGIEIPPLLVKLKIEIDEDGLVKYELEGYGER